MGAETRSGRCYFRKPSECGDNRFFCHASGVAEITVSKTTEDLAGEFLAEITAAIDNHAKAYTKDAFWYQFIVILSAVCGLLSLIAGTATNNAVLAGIIRRVTTI